MATGNEFDPRDRRRGGPDVPDETADPVERDGSRGTDELDRPGPGQQPTVQLPRGTGGQRPARRPPGPTPPQPTEQVRRPRDPRAREGAPARRYDAGADPRAEGTARPGAGPRRSRPAGGQPSGSQPAVGPSAGGQPTGGTPTGGPPSGRNGPPPRRGGVEPGYGNADYNGAGQGGADHNDAGYSDAGYSGADYRGADYRGADYSGAGRGDAGYGDPGRGGQYYRDRDYPEPGYRDRPSRDPGYRGRGSREPGYRDRAYREPGSPEQDYPEPGYPDQGIPDRGYREPRYRDDRDRGYDRQAHPDQAHPDQAHSDQAYLDPAYRDQDYPDPSYGAQRRGYRDPDRRYREPDQGYGDPEYGDPEYGDPDQDYGEPDYLPAEVEPRRLPAVPDQPDRRPAQRPPSGFAKAPRPGPASDQHRQSHLPPYVEPDLQPQQPASGPRKLTVTRVAALRSKELTNKGVQLFRRATTADGADRSGLTHLTYAVMANYAVDAALAVALANTLFFAAASAESTGKVLLYLLITVAPFAVIAPFIGPMLDKVQNGRRIALAITSFGRTLLAVIMAFNFDSWILYPCALGMMVLSKSFGVLKAALTPRVLPEQITLVKTNSRLTVFGLIAGGVSGAFAAGFTAISNSSGALLWTAACGVAGGVLCLRIPAWVESTEGEVPVQHSEVLQRTGKRRRLPTSVSATLWANIANRIETGFLALFIAFVVKTEYTDVSGFGQLLLLGIVGAAAGVGGFVGNALGAKLPLNHPERIAWFSVLTVAVTTFIAILIPGLAMGAIVGLIGSTSSSLAKVCLDSVLQHELPEASRASAFGMSESALQLAWVGGGVVGLLLGGVLHVQGDGGYMLGFGVITVLVATGLVQSWLRRSGRSLFPEPEKLFGRTKNRAAPAQGGRGGGPGGPATRPYAGSGPPAAPGPSGGSGADPAGGSRTKRRPRRAGDPR